VTESTRAFPFRIDVPCLLRPAAKGAPLVVVLHGKGEDIPESVERVGARGSDLSWAFPRAPYPEEIGRRGEIEVGWSWYQYTGDPDEFRESLRVTGDWLLAVIDGALEETKADPSRVFLLGFSQGGYLAGSLALTRPDRFAGAALLGSRFKTELLDGDLGGLGHLRLFAGHGSRDRAVKPEPAARRARELAEAGVAIEHREYRCGHRVLPEMMDDALEWLLGE
jgi:phospholipase/carboxylesterase